MTTYTVKTPTKWTGRRYDVLIYEGEGHTDDPWVARQLLQFDGWTVEPEPPALVTTRSVKNKVFTVEVDPEVMRFLNLYDAQDLIPDEFRGIVGWDEVRPALEKRIKKDPDRYFGLAPLPEVQAEPEPEAVT